MTEYVYIKLICWTNKTGRRYYFDQFCENNQLLIFIQHQYNKSNNRKLFGIESKLAFDYIVRERCGFIIWRFMWLAGVCVCFPLSILLFGNVSEFFSSRNRQTGFWNLTRVTECVKCIRIISFCCGKARDSLWMLSFRNNVRIIHLDILLKKKSFAQIGSISRYEILYRIRERKSDSLSL